MSKKKKYISLLPKCTKWISRGGFLFVVLYLKVGLQKTTEIHKNNIDRKRLQLWPRN